MECGALAHCAFCTARSMNQARQGLVQICPDFNPIDNSKTQTENRKKYGNKHIHSRTEMNCIWGLKQQHFRVPPVSLWVDTRGFEGVGGCPTWSCSILGAFWYFYHPLLDNESTYTRNFCSAVCGLMRREKKLTVFLNKRSEYENMIKEW